MGLELTGKEAVLIILAFFAPPLAVFAKVGLYANFWINIGLTLLGWVPGGLCPGILHGWYVIVGNSESKKKKA